MTWFDGSVTRLAGIASWGLKCGQDDYPSVFTRLTSEVVDWMEDIIYGDNICSKFEPYTSEWGDKQHMTANVL